MEIPEDLKEDILRYAEEFFYEFYELERIALEEEKFNKMKAFFEKPKE